MESNIVVQSHKECLQIKFEAINGSAHLAVYDGQEKLCTIIIEHNLRFSLETRILETIIAEKTTLIVDSKSFTTPPIDEPGTKIIQEQDFITQEAESEAATIGVSANLESIKEDAPNSTAIEIVQSKIPTSARSYPR